MRALSDPDVFLPGDVGVVRALQQLAAGRPGANGSGVNGLSANGSGAHRPGVGGAAANGSRAGKASANGSRSLAAAERWRPWRSYATHHLWAALESASARAGGTRAEAITARV
jgi:3-methyladenine DNA glycosylase/8-oxoguanine DNA glycosylase